MTWEIDWNHPDNTGLRVMSRNPQSRISSAREWHLIYTGDLRRMGIDTPVYMKTTWEVDWSKRKSGSRVWARNPKSKMPKSREWHWVDQKTLNMAGITWVPAEVKTAPPIDADGYVTLTRKWMTEEEIELANRHNLWLGAKKAKLKQHTLEAVKKYGAIPPGFVVRHINGIKSDNRPENLLLGTTQENTMDHNTARLAAMFWREQYEIAIKKLIKLGQPPEMIESGEALHWVERMLGYV